MGQEIRLQRETQRRDAHRHAERIAAIGRAMRARRHALGRFGGGETRAERKAAADPLGDRHDVGRDAQPIISEQLAGAPNAGLDFVEDQKQAVLVAQFAQAAQEFRRQHAHAALALHRLDQDGGGLMRDRRFHQLQIAGGNGIEPVDLGAEAFEIFRIAARGDAASVRLWKAPSKVMMRKRSGWPLTY